MSVLDKVVTGVVDSPPRLLVWGEPGVGKSTFASGFPKALFIEAEPRTGHLDIDRFPVGDWMEALTAIHEVSQGETEYQTIVIDTMNALVDHCLTYIAKAEGVPTHEDIGGGFAKYRTPMMIQLRRLIALIDKVKATGIHVVMLAHGVLRTVTLPDQDPYDAWDLDMDKKASSYLKQNMDLIGHAKFHLTVGKAKGLAKGKAVSSNSRSLNFALHPGFPNKRGVPCKEKCDLTYEGYIDAIAKE